MGIETAHLFHQSVLHHLQHTGVDTGIQFGPGARQTDFFNLEGTLFAGAGFERGKRTARHQTDLQRPDHPLPVGYVNRRI